MRKLSMANSAIPSVALVAALAFGAFAEAQVYKWVDDKGVVNYSSTPPEKRKRTKLDEDNGRVSTVESPLHDLAWEAHGDRERARRQHVKGREEQAPRNPARAPTTDHYQHNLA